MRLWLMGVATVGCLAGLECSVAWPRAQAQESQVTSAPAETITLREVLQKALAEPPRVLAALATLQRTQAELAVAKATYLPTLTLQATEGITYDNRQTVPNGLIAILNQALAAQNQPLIATEKGRVDYVSLTTSGTANLDWSVVNIARRHGIRASERSREAQLEAVTGVQRLALASASELYMRALSASQFVEDAELTYQRRTQQYQGISGLVKAGLRPPVDETRARIEVVAAQYKLEVRKVDERASFAALAAAVGRDPRQPLRPEPIVESPFKVPTNSNDAGALALEHRPELKSLEKTLATRQAELKAALWRRAPTLGLSSSATASYLDQIQGDGYQGSQYSAQAVGYLRWQGLDPTIWRQADVQRAALLEAQRNFEAVWLDVQAQVIDAAFGVERANAELQRASQVLSAAQATREAQNGRYQTGVASLLELLDAESVEQTSRFEKIAAERDFEVARIRLLAATGLINQLAR